MPSSPFPFRRGDRPPGVSDWTLRTPAYRRLFHDVYVERTAELDAAAAAPRGPARLPGRDRVAPQRGPAVGAVVPDDGAVHLSCAGSRPQVEGITAHRGGPGRAVTSWRGLRLTTPAQTFLDLATVLALVDLVVLGDSLVRRGRVSPGQLVEAAAAHHGRGARLARRAAGLVRAGVDSAVETRLRLLIVLAGLPEPVVDHRIRRPDGSVRFRFDLSYPHAGLVVEYDGWQHVESEQQWGSDRDRREWLDHHDWRIVVVIAKDLRREPATTLHRICAAMRDRGLPVPVLRDEWRRHFPSLPGDLRDPG